MRMLFGGSVQPPTFGIDPLDICGNGRLATGDAAGKLANYINRISAGRRRILAQWTRRPLVSGIAGTTAWDTIAYFRIRMSYQCDRVRAVIVAVPSDSVDDAATPGLRFRHQEVEGPGLLNIYRTINIGRRDAGTIVPDDYFILNQVLSYETNTSGTDAMVPGRNYDLLLDGRGGARVLSVTLFEESGRLYYDNPQNSGVGTSIDITAVAPYAQLSDPAATFNQTDIGAELVITDADSGVNSGTFRIHRVVSSTEVEYLNTSAVTEAFLAGTRYKIRSASVVFGATGGQIVDDDIDRLLEIPHNIWKDGGGHLFSWADSQTAATRTSATYANIHDQTTTAWATTSFGHWTWPYYCGSYTSTQVPITMWARGTIGGGGTGNVRFLVNGRTVGTVAITGSGTLATATGYLDSTEVAQKVDVHFAGDGVNQLSVFGFGAYQYST